MLVQGPGGNTSVKFGNIMWIKASGTLLSNAGMTEIFTPVDVQRAVAEIDLGEVSPKHDIRLDPEDGHRPSIETGFHALLPWKYVFHYHSVNALAHLTSEEGQTAALAKLSDLSPIPIGYSKPGIPLSRMIRESINGRDSRVVLLKNHGMIVCGNSIAEIRNLIDKTEKRLWLNPEVDCAAEPGQQEFPGWVSFSGSGLFEQDPLLAKRLTSGCYFPDQAVFLGPEIPVLSADELQKRPDPCIQAAVIQGGGLHLRAGAPTAVREQLECLIAVLARIPKSWNPRTLANSEIGELIDWDAEKYRRALSEKNSN